MPQLESAGHNWRVCMLHQKIPEDTVEILRAPTTTQCGQKKKHYERKEQWWYDILSQELMLLNCGAREDLRVPWTARRSNQSILKEISPEYSLGGLMLRLKLQYFATWCKELTYWKRPWFWERLKAGEEGDDRGWDGWMASLTLDISLSKLQETWSTGKPDVLQSMGSQRVRHDWPRGQQQRRRPQQWIIWINFRLSLMTFCSLFQWNPVFLGVNEIFKNFVAN